MIEVHPLGSWLHKEMVCRKKQLLPTNRTRRECEWFAAVEGALGAQENSFVCAEVDKSTWLTKNSGTLNIYIT